MSRVTIIPIALSLPRPIRPTRLFSTDSFLITESVDDCRIPIHYVSLSKDEFRWMELIIYMYTPLRTLYIKVLKLISVHVSISFTDTDICKLSLSVTDYVPSP